MKKKRIMATLVATMLAVSSFVTTVSATEINNANTYMEVSTLENGTSYEMVEQNATTMTGTVTNCVQLNVRAQSNAKTTTKILGVLKKGDKVTVTSKLSNGWVKIKYKTGYGYVNGKYLSIKTTTSNKVTITAMTKTGYVTASSLNVRKSYSATSAKLGALAKNKAVSITGKASNGWYRIKYNGGTGYVSGDYITFTKPSTDDGKVSATRAKVIARAKEMVNVKWTAPISFKGWRANNTFTKNKTYTGIPYSQTVNQMTSGTNFKNNLKNMASTYSRFGITMPKFGNDCSGFVSAALGIGRITTVDFLNSSKFTTLDSYNELKPGDFLVYRKNGSGHVILFASWANASKTIMNVYEQTPPKAVYQTRTVSSLKSGGYKARRLNTLK